MPDSGMGQIESRRAQLKRRMKEMDTIHVKNGRALQEAVKKWADCAHEYSLLALVAALGNAFVGLVRRTPVDTGRARAGWHIEPRSSEWKPKPGVYEKAKGDASATIAETLAKFTNLDLTKADTIYIMNNLEYIKALEAGWSRQGAGFFALFQQELTAQLEAASAASRRR